MSNHQSKGLLFTGIITAISASLCCITPVLALVAGSSSMASTFSWMEPFRPYLITITIAVLGYAWYQKLNPATNVDNCGCDTESKRIPFMKTKSFLIGVTIFTSASMAFPYYAHIFYPKHNNQTHLQQDTTTKYEFKIKGMTCQGCEEHVKQAVSSINGTKATDVSYKEGSAVIMIDTSKTNTDEVRNIIEKNTGYKVKRTIIRDE